MLKAVTQGLAGQQKQMRNWKSACSPAQHNQGIWERNSTWKLVLPFP